MPDTTHERIHAEVQAVVGNFLCCWAMPPVELAPAVASEIKFVLGAKPKTQLSMTMLFSFIDDGEKELLCFESYRLVAAKAGGPAELSRCSWPIASGAAAVALAKELCAANSALLELESRPKNFKIEKVNFDDPKEKWES